MKNEWVFIDWFSELNYDVMLWVDANWWVTLAWCFFVGSLFSMSPLLTHKDLNFLQTLGVWLRKVILIVASSLILLPFLLLYFYDLSTQNQPGESSVSFLQWFRTLALSNYHLIPAACLAGWTIRLVFNRYVLTSVSALLRKIRKTQTNDKQSDVVREAERYKQRLFDLRKHYTSKGLVLGEDENRKPVIVPWETWKENMMQVLGPTGFGKGVILGAIAEQTVLAGHTVFSINPKVDKFLPYILFEAAKKQGRPFYYISLNDGHLGSWAPFAGGSLDDGFTRLLMAFKLELSGEPKTDFYKRQEMKGLRKAFEKTRRVDGLFNEIEGKELHTAEAGLELWKYHKSLCPGKSGKGFSVSKAIEENAVVYVHGSLDNSILKMATRVFIAEVIQETRRLFSEGKKANHLNLIVDETSFLVSQVLKEALATIRSYEVSIVNAYQSPNDLLNVEDDSIDGRALKDSMDINSQIKAIYGGANYELAEWAALMSGTTTKEVTKSEKTDIQAGGAETWESQRTIGTVEENLIHPNVLLALGKGVCVFKQPYKLPAVMFTSFIPIKSREGLDEILNFQKKEPQQLTTRETEITPEVDNSPSIDGFIRNINEESHAKSEFIVPPISHVKLSSVPEKETGISHVKSEEGRVDADLDLRKKEKQKRRKAKQKEAKNGSETEEPCAELNSFLNLQE